MDDKRSTLGEELSSAGMVASDAGLDNLSKAMSLFGITVEQLMNAFSGFMDTCNAMAELGKLYAVAVRRTEKRHCICRDYHKSSYIIPHRKITPTARSRLDYDVPRKTAK